MLLYKFNYSLTVCPTVVTSIIAHIKETSGPEVKGQSCSSLAVDITIIPLFRKMWLEQFQEAGRLIIILDMHMCVRMCLLMEKWLGWMSHSYRSIYSWTYFGYNVYTRMNCMCVRARSHTSPLNPLLYSIFNISDSNCFSNPRILFCSSSLLFI